MPLSQLDWLMKAHKIKGYKPEMFDDLRAYPGGPRCSTKAYWSLLGVTDYAFTDIKSSHKFHKIDLNIPLENKDLWHAADLVTDFGNNEHAFNVGEAYRTMHRLCKPGGYMWITQGMFAGNGYYTFDENFFEGMAASNNYGIYFAGFVVTLDKEQYHIPLSRKLLLSLNPANVEVGVTYILHKKTDADFNYAYQGGGKSQGRLYYDVVFQSPNITERSYVPISVDQLSGKAMIRELTTRITTKFLGLCKVQ